MASRGVTQVYSLGDEATRKELLAGLTGVLQGQARPVKVTGDTKVLEEPAQGAGGAGGSGGNLSTYQELCSLATDLGQPDLVYRWPLCCAVCCICMLTTDLLCRWGHGCAGVYVCAVWCVLATDLGQPDLVYRGEVG
jgi:hypothetical protein